MSEDHEFYDKIAERKEKIRTREKINPKVDTIDNSVKTKMLKEILNEIDKEEASIQRQDIIIYKFRFPCITQAISIILGVVMLINAIVYLVLYYQQGGFELSWITFGETGAMFLFSAFTVPRKEMTKPRRSKVKDEDPRIRDLKFAFINSLTWFICGICMAIISLLIFDI